MPAPPLDTTPLLKPAAPPPLRTVGGGSSADAQPWWDTDPDQGLHRHRCCGDRLPEEEDRTAGRCRGGLCGGVRDDYRRRCPMYWRDLRSGLRAKTLSAAIFMFIATFCSTVSLGMFVQKKTNNRIGVAEYLLVNSVGGMVHALLGCQPLLVLRPTGPITAIMIMMSGYADRFQIPFGEYLGATGIFIGLYMTTIASCELSRLIKHLSRFTHEIFACFVCSLYVMDGLSEVVAGFDGGEREMGTEQFGEALYSVLIACAVFGMAIWLHTAVSWASFNATIRGLLTDYAVAASIAAITLLTLCWSTEQLRFTVPRLDMPDSFRPTCQHELTSLGSNRTTVARSIATDCSCSSRAHCAFANNFTGSSPRPWFVYGVGSRFLGTTPETWLVAALSAVPIVIFFYFDQNLSSLLTQQPEMQMRLGSFYNSSFLWMGLLNIVGPLFGLPFVTGSLPHSPQLAKALTIYNYDADQKAKIDAVVENRLAPFLMYMMIGLPIFTPQFLQAIPAAALNGVLIFVGVSGLFDLQLWERVQLLYHHPQNFSSRYNGIHWTKVHLFTILQLAIFCGFWAVNHISFFLVPFLIVGVVGARRCLLPYIFTTRELDTMDSDLVTLNIRNVIMVLLKQKRFIRILRRRIEARKKDMEIGTEATPTTRS